MSEYLPNATCFDGMVKNPPVPGRVECPVCKGYGGWVLMKNAYRGTTPEQRDFRAGCNQCHSRGYVLPGTPDETCVHDYKPANKAQLDALGITLYMHDHCYVCSKCGKWFMTDSSD